MARTGLAAILAATLAACAHARAPRDPQYVSGDQIALVQRALAGKGQPVPVTGNWNPATRAALASFQRGARLEATGTLDVRTARGLGISREAIDDDVLDPEYPFVNCRVYQTVDCRPDRR